MTISTYLPAMAITLSLAIASPSLAGGSGGSTVINGATTIEAFVGLQTSIAVGDGNSATAEIATINEGAKVNGSARLNGAVGAETGIAVGAGSTAVTALATVRGVSTGPVALATSTGSVTTLAIGAGSSACTSIASVNQPVGGFASTVGTGAILNVGIGPLFPGRVSIGSVGSPC